MSIITFDVFFYVFCNRRITDQQMKALCHYVLIQAIENVKHAYHHLQKIP